MNPIEELSSGSLCARSADGGTWTADDDGTITGRAVPYGVAVELIPGVRETFRRGAFASAVKDPHRVKLALRHDEIIGRAETLEERDDGLWLRGLVSMSPDVPAARQARALLLEGLVDELSVGFRSPRGGYATEKDGDGVLITHHRATLHEVSVVPWGAYGRHALVTSAREDELTVTNVAAAFEVPVSLLEDPAMMRRELRRASERDWWDSLMA